MLWSRAVATVEVQTNSSAIPTQKSVVCDARRPVIVAIFDLDGTLYTGRITRGIIRHHRTHRVKRPQLYIYLATHTASLPLWRLGLLSEEFVRDLWARHLGWTVRGWTRQQAATAFAWIAEHYVKPLVRPDVLGRVRSHQAAGHRTILVSGTPAPLLAEIGQTLGIDETVGTPLTLLAGRYTGACELPVCQGSGKVFRLKAHIGDDPIVWPESYVYADSHTDLVLLSLAGFPVAVYPDAKLASYARSQGWEVLG